MERVRSLRTTFSHTSGDSSGVLPAREATRLHALIVAAKTIFINNLARFLAPRYNGGAEERRHKPTGRVRTANTLLDCRLTDPELLFYVSLELSAMRRAYDLAPRQEYAKEHNSEFSVVTGCTTRALVL